MKLTYKQSNFDSQNEVADLEIVIPPELNNADYVNDVLISAIYNTGFYAIGNEIRWEKNLKEENVLRYFGATEGRTTLAKVIKTLEALDSTIK
jgi:hypothetical protein